MIMNHVLWISCCTQKSIFTHTPYMSTFLRDFLCDAQQTYCVYLELFPFSVLESFGMTQTPYVTCKENEHCQLKCTGKPICELQNECTVIWYQGTGTTNVIKRNESTAVDLEG